MSGADFGCREGAPVVASQVIDMLRRHYLPEGRQPGGIFATEIEAPNGLRRADAIWAPWTVAGGAALVGHEVKVSRSDVLVELADPMKSEPWVRHCSRWWLVVSDPALVTGLDVPAEWGILAPPSGRRRRSMTVLRDAPVRKVAATGEGWRRVAAWQHHQMQQRITDLAYEVERYKASTDLLNAQLADRMLAGEGRASAHAVMVGRIVSEIQRQDFSLRNVDPDEVVAALRDVQRYRRLKKSLAMEIGLMADQARSLTQPVVRIAGELDALKRGAE